MSRYGTFGKSTTERKDLLDAIELIQKGDDFTVDEAVNPINTTGSAVNDFLDSYFMGQQTKHHGVL